MKAFLFGDIVHVDDLQSARVWVQSHWLVGYLQPMMLVHGCLQSQSQGCPAGEHPISNLFQDLVALQGGNVFQTRSVGSSDSARPPEFVFGTQCNTCGTTTSLADGGVLVTTSAEIVCTTTCAPVCKLTSSSRQLAKWRRTTPNLRQTPRLCALVVGAGAASRAAARRGLGAALNDHPFAENCLEAASRTKLPLVLGKFLGSALAQLVQSFAHEVSPTNQSILEEKHRLQFAQLSSTPTGPSGTGATRRKLSSLVSYPIGTLNTNTCDGVGATLITELEECQAAATAAGLWVWLEKKLTIISRGVASSMDNGTECT